MNILFVSATQFEITELLNFLEIKSLKNKLTQAKKKIGKHNVSVLITGVGMVNTALKLGRYNHHSFDLLINVGICGAFDKKLKLGDLVTINEDVFSELGAEDGKEFLTFDQLNLGSSHIFKNCHQSKKIVITELRNVIGITVNTIHGNATSISKVIKLYHPNVESMEGAAFFAACENINKNYLQIRAVSNYVEKRNKSKWQMQLAVKNLNAFLIKFLSNDLKN